MVIWYCWKIAHLTILEEFGDTKGVIRIHKSKDRQHNGQKKKDKQWSTKHTHKTKDRETRTPQKTGVNSGRYSFMFSNYLFHITVDDPDFKAGIASLSMILQVPPYNSHLEQLKVSYYIWLCLNTSQTNFFFKKIDTCQLWYLSQKFNIYTNVKNFSSCPVGVFVSNAVDFGIEPWSGQTNDHKIGICCFSVKYAALRSKSKDILVVSESKTYWLSQNQRHTGCLRIRIMYLSGAAYLLARCCYSELVLKKCNSACWSSSKGKSPSHGHVTCSKRRSCVNQHHYSFL